MACPTGTLVVEHGDRSIALRLTMAGLARLQQKHGRDVGGLLSGEMKAGEFPDLGVILDVVSVAVEKGEGLSPPDAAEIADELLTRDLTLIERLMATAFPDMVGKAGSAAGNEAGAA